MSVSCAQQVTEDGEEVQSVPFKKEFVSSYARLFIRQNFILVPIQMHTIPGCAFSGAYNRNLGIYFVVYIPDK